MYNKRFGVKFPIQVSVDIFGGFLFPKTVIYYKFESNVAFLNYHLWKKFDRSIKKTDFFMVLPLTTARYTIVQGFGDCSIFGIILHMYWVVGIMSGKAIMCQTWRSYNAI